MEATRWFWGVGTASSKEVVLEDIGNDFLGVGLDASVADVLGTGCADFVGGDAVGLGVEDIV